MNQWTSTGLVTEEKISEVLALLKSRVYSETPPVLAPVERPAGQDRTSFGSKGKDSKVATPDFVSAQTKREWVVVSAFGLPIV